MQRAQRLFNLPPDLTAQIAAVKAQARAAGRDVIDLASDELNWPLPSAVREALGCIAAEPSVRDSNTAAVQAEFREAVARWLASRYGVTVDAESEMTPIAGPKAAWAQAVWAAVNPGDGVLLPELVAPWVKASVLLAGGVPHDIPLQAEKDWRPDLTAVPGEAVQKAKLLYLNFPHNPTGAAATPAFLQDAVNFAQETGVIIFHDLGYAVLGEQAPSLLMCSGAADVAVERHAGFAVGSVDAIRAMTQVQSAVGGDAPLAIMPAAAWALNNVRLDEMPTVLTRRRDTLVKELSGLGWNIGDAQQGPFVWLPVPPGQTSASFAQALLEQADVLTVPGLVFGPTGDGHVRLSLTVNEERMAEAVQRMSRIL